MMKNTIVAYGLFGSLMMGSCAVMAAPITLNVSGEITDLSGSYAGGDLAIGQVVLGSFVFDTDELNADPGAQTEPSADTDDDFSSAYGFSGALYGVSLSIPAIGGSFDTSSVEVRVSNDRYLTAAESNGLLADGVYDMVEIMGFTTSGVCLLPGGCSSTFEYSPSDGEEFSLVILGDWFSDGSVIPDGLPADFTALIVGNEYDAAGNVIGAVWAPLDSVTVSAVPVPAAVWLFGSGLLGLVGVARRKGR